MPAHEPKGFRRNFMDLATGSALAQILSLALMPVITRLYSPSEMGEYALYVSISSILGLLANLRLDMAVVLAEDEDEASRLVWLGLAASVIGGFVCLAALTGIRGLGLFTYATASTTAFIGGVQTLMNWHSREKNFRLIAGRNFFEKIIVLTCGIGLGYLGYTAFGLFAAQTLGFAFAFFYLFFRAGLRAPRFSRRLWKQTFRKFHEFPLKNMLSALLLASAFFMPAILMAHFFNKAELGQYNLVNRLFEMPIYLIANTFSTVYYQHSQNTASARRLELFWRSIKILGAVFIPLFLFVALTGPWLFAFVFGEVWRPAGELARWLALFTSARLIYTTQSPLLFVQRKLGLDLAISAALFATQIGFFFIGYFYFGSVHWCVLLMSVSGMLTYLAGLKAVHRIIRRQ